MDYFLFRKLKKWMGGKRFANKSAIDDYFGAPDGSHYSPSVKTVEYCWEKCIELSADCVGK